jgi:3-deoxy-7-phosphoheptulonate synthase
MIFPTDDLRIKSTRVVLAPCVFHEELPLTESASATVYHTRNQICEILHGRNDRLLVVVGPCSIHDVQAALEYGSRLKGAIDQLSKELLIVMRVYFDKPRTTIGWKGMINDPYMDKSFKINDGLRMARRLLLDLAEMGVPAGSEFLDPMTPQYFTDLVSWGAIGARTTESQVHRELSSGLSCPIGFKNGTSGNVQVAIEAILTAAHPHYFVAYNRHGQSSIFGTKGNPDCHVILRGGGGGVNYTAESVSAVCAKLEAEGLPARIMIDCSHANSKKDHTKQQEVCRNVAGQIAAGDPRICGVMMESHLIAGTQPLQPGRALVYGQSITDPCMGWSETFLLLEELSKAVRVRRTSSRLSLETSASMAPGAIGSDGSPSAVNLQEIRKE